MRKIFMRSCLITYFGVLFGILAIYFAFNKVAFSEIEIVKFALICLMISGVCDMFDGKFARSCKRTKEEKEIGIQMDSLADTFCFLIVPVVLMLTLKLDSPVYLVIYTFFIISGITRLAYFNVNADADKSVDYFTGLPVTTTAIIFPLAGLLHTIVSAENFGIILIIITALWGFLFNCKIKIPKIKSLWFYIIIPILAAILAVIMVVII